MANFSLRHESTREEPLSTTSSVSSRVEVYLHLTPAHQPEAGSTDRCLTYLDLICTSVLGDSLAGCVAAPLSHRKCTQEVCKPLAPPPVTEWWIQNIVICRSNTGYEVPPLLTLWWLWLLPLLSSIALAYKNRAKPLLCGNNKITTTRFLFSFVGQRLRLRQPHNCLSSVSM